MHYGPLTEEEKPSVENEKIKNNIWVFDDAPDEELSSYDSHHLEILLEAEKKHFWLQCRKNYIASIFTKFVTLSSRILEIGTGTGFIAEKLQQMGFHIEASDCTPNGLEHAFKRGIKTLYQFDLFNPPFQEAFDVICLFDVLEHLKDERLAIENLKKMLKPQGMIILTVPAHQWLWSSDDELAGHHRRYSKKSLQDCLEACGFQIHYCRYFFVFILPLLILRKWIRKKPRAQHVNLQIPKFLSHFLGGLTNMEFRLGRLVPNLCGGSLIAIARKK